VTQKSFISGTANPTFALLEYHLSKDGLSDAQLETLQDKIGNITAMVQIGSVGGALIAFIACDKLGMPAIHTGLVLEANGTHRTNMGYPTTMSDLAYRRDCFHDIWWKLWTSVGRQIRDGFGNRTNHCSRSSVSRNLFRY
jgi:hypothetical protein